MAKIINIDYLNRCKKEERQVNLSNSLCKEVALEKMMSHANAYTHTDDDFYYSLLGEEIEEDGNKVELSEKEKKVMKNEFEAVYKILRERMMKHRKNRCQNK